MLRKKLNVLRTDPKVFADIRSSGDSLTVQDYNPASGEYTPDHRVNPLVLTPVVGYRDQDTGETVEDAGPELSGGKWYRLDSETAAHMAAVTAGTPDPGVFNAANEITDTPGKYEISYDPASYGRLSILENTPAGHSVTYMFVATLTVGVGRTVSCSYTCTTRITEVVPEMYFDNVALTAYNPLEDHRYFAIHPKVAGGLPAVFAWESWHETAYVGGAWKSGVWTALGSTAMDWAVAKDGDGVRIDRTLMQGSIRLRCVATVTVGDKQVTLTKEVAHVRRLPKLTKRMTRVGQLTPGIKTISPCAMVSSSRRRIDASANGLDELDVRWCDSAEKVIARGLNPQMSVSALGTAMELGLEVLDRGGWCALADSDGTLLTDSDGALLIVREDAGKEA